MTEKLVECAYRTPSGEVTHGCQSHAELLNYEPKNPYDTYGFWTSADRFVTRAEAVPIGVAARQLSESWLNVSRELLSSDIRW